MKYFNHGLSQLVNKGCSCCSMLLTVLNTHPYKVKLWWVCSPVATTAGEAVGEPSSRLSCWGGPRIGPRVRLGTERCGHRELPVHREWGNSL